MAPKKKDDDNLKLVKNLSHVKRTEETNPLELLLKFLETQKSAIQVLVEDISECLDIPKMGKFEVHMKVINGTYQKINTELYAKYIEKMSNDFFWLKNQDGFQKRLDAISQKMIDLSDLINRVSPKQHDVSQIYRGLLLLKSSIQSFINEIEMNNLKEQNSKDEIS